MSLSKRTDVEQREQQTLAGYAALSSQSRGRVYQQEEHPLRTAFQRDRDRIVHSSAFRRMEYKTQVFLPHEADHFRTRLTHTIEVAQVSRTLARNLRLNEDLTEAIALVHDLGHTPFGHSGEDVLDELLRDRGGFNHNRQSLRVVDLLEQRYPDHPGLNLSYEVREGIAKHETKVPFVSDEFSPGTWPTLEASLVDKADEIAYCTHDLDDGVNSDLIALDDLRELDLWKTVGDRLGLSLIGEKYESLSIDEKRPYLVRYVIDTLATDLLLETEARLQRLGVTDLESLRRAAEPACRFSAKIDSRVQQLKGFLQARLYQHPHLVKRAEQAHEIIETLYRKFIANPERMPLRFQQMLSKESIEIVVADYIAGMTDRYAEKLYQETE